MDGVVGDFDSLPALSVIPCKFKLVSSFANLGSDNKSSMVSDIVDVVARVSRFEGHSSVSRNIKILLNVVLREIVS
jgi:hypothetical protein